MWRIVLPHRWACVPGREELESWVRSRSLQAGLVNRARIVLLAAEGVPNREIAARVGASPTTVIQWRSRCAGQGPAGPEDHRRSGRPRELDHAAIVTATLMPPPEKLGVTHWSSRLLARQLKIGNATVARAWRAYGIKRRSHDDYRHGTTTLFAALEIATGKVAAALKPRHRHQEFLAFLQQIERTYRDAVEEVAGEPVELHLVMSNYAAHKRKNVREWLTQNPRFVVHFTPTHASWVNLVDVWFGLVERRAVRRGVVESVPELNAELRAYIEGWNKRARPFAWTKTAEEVLEKANRPTTPHPHPRTSRGSLADG